MHELSTAYTLHSTPPRSSTKIMATSTDDSEAGVILSTPPRSSTKTDGVQKELIDLRQRNKQLQSQVDDLTRQLESSAKSLQDKENSLEEVRQVRERNKVNRPLGPVRSLSGSEGKNDGHAGLHHRRVLRKDGKGDYAAPNELPASNTDSSSPSKTSKCGTPTASKVRPDHDDAGPREEADFDNECDKNIHLPKPKGNTRSSSDGGGRYMHPLSIVHSDEEEGRFPDALTSPVRDAGGDDDDDDSHRKHLPRILQIPNSPGDCGQTINSHTAGFQPFWENLKERSRWLIGLLFFQSCSSFIIQYNEEFLQDHMVIVQFLTMLVGAGGNAGNQASVGVIRSLAIGTLNRHTTKFYLWREAKMAVSLSALIGLTGFVRAAIFRTPPGETIAITASVFAIVAISVGIGTTLPLAMKKVGIDPCHSSTSIQVIMDILGVLITVCVSTLVLNLKAFQSAG